MRVSVRVTAAMEAMTGFVDCSSCGLWMDFRYILVIIGKGLKIYIEGLYMHYIRPAARRSAAQPCSAPPGRG